MSTRVHMWKDIGEDVYCGFAAGWEAVTVDRNEVTCESCLAAMPPPPRIPLYTMLLRDRDTGREEEIYGHATARVMAEFAVPNLDNPRFGDGNWEVVIRRYIVCDWSHCQGHEKPDQVCSITRRYEFDEREAMR